MARKALSGGQPRTSGSGYWTLPVSSWRRSTAASQESRLRTTAGNMCLSSAYWKVQLARGQVGTSQTDSLSCPPVLDGLQSPHGKSPISSDYRRFAPKYIAG